MIRFFEDTVFDFDYFFSEQSWNRKGSDTEYAGIYDRVGAGVYLAMSMTSYLTSASVYYEFILLLISAIRWFMEAFILPCIEIYVLLVLANNLSKESRLTRFADCCQGCKCAQGRCSP